MRTDGDAGFARMAGASLRPLILAASIGLAGACGSSPDPIPPVSTPPTNLRYSTNPATYTRGVAITANTPSSDGGRVESYSVAPALPAGLSLSTATGAIAGTPTAIAAAAAYVVTAANALGSTSAVLSITISDVAPGSLEYSTKVARYVKGVPIGANVPSSSGGSVVSYSVAPPLPAGLGLDASTGVISGTPAVIAAAANYVVTATNSGGSTSGAVSIEVVDVPIAAGVYHTCALVNGGVQCWGLNDWGQLGNNSTASSLVPVQVAGLATGVQGVAAGGSGVRGCIPGTSCPSGGSHTCAVVNGGVQCWGFNDWGQLGNNSTANSLVPVQVAGLASGVQGIAAGGSHTCALVNGGVQCWGYNGSGQLGNNSTANSLVPVQVAGLASGVLGIAAGRDHTCAVVSGGVQCWGYNGSGQLGDDTTTGSLVPVHVSGLTSGVQGVAAGGSHTCALVNGGVKCWGHNDFGQLGNNSTANSFRPVQVAGLASGVTAIATGILHTCAVVNGGAQCWGNNDLGQLGNNSTANSLMPVQVAGLTSGVRGVAGGGIGEAGRLGGNSHTCAVVNGGVQCWGHNGSGQLGNSTAPSPGSLVPVEVAGLASGVP